MFVFSYMDIPHILNVTITTMEPTRVRPYKPVPAYVLFLAARFAHHYSTSGLLDELLDATTRAISDVTQVRIASKLLDVAVAYASLDQATNISLWLVIIE